MTEAEWERATDPAELLRFAGPRVSRRKLLLFGAARGRRAWDVLDPAMRDAVRAAGRVADGRAEPVVLRGAVERVAGPLWAEWAWPADEEHAPDPATLVLHGAAVCANGRDEERAAQAAFLRDIVGNPFRPVETDPSWLTSDVLALARGIYEDRAFDRLPILADALQDAGCTDETVLGHCRDENAEHVRGCWIVDLVLGKE